MPTAVAELKQVGDGELHVIGSTELVRTLIAHDLVDELRLMIDPVLLGGGKRIFQDDGVLRRWRLIDGRGDEHGRDSRDVRSGRSLTPSTSARRARHAPGGRDRPAHVSHEGIRCGLTNSSVHLPTWPGVLDLAFTSIGL